MSSDPIKEKSPVNYHIQFGRISILFIISITVVSSSLYLLPLAYSQALLSGPTGIAVDQEGNVYVADTANHRIQVFSGNGTIITKWGAYGASNGSFNQPAGIAVDQEGNVYVADTANNRIQVFSGNGTFIERWGGYGVVNGTLRSPTGIAVDQEGNVYVADTANNRIQVFSGNGTFIERWGR